MAIIQTFLDYWKARTSTGTTMQTGDELLVRRGDALLRVTGAPVPANSVANAQLANMAALTAKVNATNSSAAPQDVAYAADGDIIARSGTTLVSKKVEDANVSSPVNAAAAISGSKINFLQYGTGAIPRINRDKVSEIAVSPEDFGAIGDGVANDTAAFQAAMNTGRVVRLRDNASYRITGSGASLLATPVGGCHIVGGVNSRVLIAGTNATYYRLFETYSGPITAERVTFKIVSATGIAVIYFLASDGCGAWDCVFDGGMTYSGAYNWTAFAVQAGGANASNMLFARNKFTRFLYPWLKANADTTVNNGVWFISNDFYENFAEDLSFNAPNQPMSDIFIVNNRFRDNLGLTSGEAFRIHIAIASCRRFVISDNVHSGSILEAIHIEENCQDFVVSGNVGACDFGSTGGGVSLSENNVAGAVTNPRGGVVTGNRFRHTGGTLTDRHGVRVTYNGSADPPARDVIVSGNHCENFGVGFGGATEYDIGLVFAENTAASCSVGYFGTGGLASFRGNTSRNCAVGVRGERGEEFHDHLFDRCTAIATQSSWPVVLTNPRFSLAIFNHAGGSTSVDVDVFPMRSTDRAAGRVSGHARHTGNGIDFGYRVRDVVWDGTTLTDTAVTHRTPGAFDLTFNRTSNTYRASVFAVNACSNVKITVHFNGSIQLDDA